MKEIYLVVSIFRLYDVDGELGAIRNEVNYAFSDEKEANAKANAIAQMSDENIVVKVVRILCDVPEEELDNDYWYEKSDFELSYYDIKNDHVE